jgi:hypothetical protein
MAVALPLSNIGGKPGVTYKVERAPADKNGVATAAYEAVEGYKGSADTAAKVTAAELTADVLGNLQVSQVFDRLPASVGNYRYKITATKGSATETREQAVKITAENLRSFAGLPSSISITIAAKDDITTAGTVSYNVTIPAVTPKGALQAGDKLVFYYAKGLATGPYTEGLSFSAAELETPPTTPKKLSITKGTSDTNGAYVKAKLVFADGRTPWDVTAGLSGDGVFSGAGTITVRLDY